MILRVFLLFMLWVVYYCSGNSAVRGVKHCNENLVPDNRNWISTRFFLSTKDTGRKRNEIHVVPRIAFRQKYDSTKKVAVICHGFKSNADEKWIRRMENAFVNKLGYNVISVDWRRGANRFSYLKAVANTKVVGEEIASLVQYMITKFKISPKNFHLIGHSLGAHTVSYVANSISEKLGRITALDPASPCFSTTRSPYNLDQDDAEFVDVIHTNVKFFGQLLPLGHMDFYPNGGKVQPECLNSHKTSTWRFMESVGLNKLGKFYKKFRSSVCSHGTAAQYFTESIYDQCTFWGYKWKVNTTRPDTDVTCTRSTCAPMGMKSISSKARGTFYVFVKGQAPYCIKETEDKSQFYHSAEVDNDADE